MIGYGPRMRLCPNCRTIQKAGEPCPNCKHPILHEDDQAPPPVFDSCAVCGRPKKAGERCQYCDGVSK